MKVVDFERPGGPNVLQIKEVPYPTITSYEIMIQVVAAGVNIYDVWRRKGITYYVYGYNTCLGRECSGKVVAVGSSVSEFKVGDEVCVLLDYGGGYAEFVAVHKSQVLRVPSGVPLAYAAALPEASHITFLAFSKITNVTAGKKILIHGAAGGIGIFALQYAKHLGCEVYFVAGMEEELQLCKALGAEVCINYRNRDFCECVMSETEEGVDIILDFSDRDNFQKNFDCLARGGSLVILGHGTMICVDVDISVLKARDITVTGLDLHTLSYSGRMSLQSDVVVYFWPLIEAGFIKPVVGEIFSFDQAAVAHRAFEEYWVPGKVLLIPDEASFG